MQSLEARKKDRKRRNAENREEAKERGIDVSQSGSSFDASAFLSGSVSDVTGKLSDLSDDEFAAVMDAGDERAGVKTAIEADRKRREKRGDVNWSPNV